jgi:hypothetical protein
MALSRSSRSKVISSLMEDAIYGIEKSLASNPARFRNLIIGLAAANFIVFIVSSNIGITFSLNHKTDFLVFYKAWSYFLTNPSLVYYQTPNPGYPTCISDFSWCTGYNYGNSFLFTSAFSPIALVDQSAAGWIFRAISFLCVIGTVAILFRLFRSYSLKLISSFLILLAPFPLLALRNGHYTIFPLTWPMTSYVANYWAGQSDALILLLFTLSVYFLSRDMMKLSYLTYAISLIKPEPIVLFPLYMGMVLFHFHEKGERKSKVLLSFGWVITLVILVNLPILLYPPWLNGYVYLVQYRDANAAVLGALTSMHEYVWLYSIPVISICYVLSARMSSGRGINSPNYQLIELDRVKGLNSQVEDGESYTACPLVSVSCD